MTVSEEATQAQNQQATFWKDVVEGRAAVPVAQQHDNLRRLQIECLVNLYGARWVMTVPSSESERGRFNDYVNQIGVLFSEHPSVLLALKDFGTGGGEPSLFIKLVRSLSDACGMKLANVTDADLQGVATANGLPKPPAV